MRRIVPPALLLATAAGPTGGWDAEATAGVEPGPGRPETCQRRSGL